MKQPSAMKKIAGGLLIIALVFAVLWVFDLVPMVTVAPTEEEGSRMLIPSDGRMLFSLEELIGPGETGEIEPVGEGEWLPRDVLTEEGTYRGDRPMLLTIAREETLFKQQCEPMENIELLMREDLLLGGLLITVEEEEWSGTEEEILTLLIDSQGNIAKRYEGPVGEEELLQGITLLFEEEQ